MMRGEKEEKDNGDLKKKRPYQAWFRFVHETISPFTCARLLREGKRSVDLH